MLCCCLGCTHAHCNRCLEDHSNAADFTADCRTLVYGEERQQAARVDLNAPVMAACRKELALLCASSSSAGGSSSSGGGGSSVATLACLIDKRNDPAVGASMAFASGVASRWWVGRWLNCVGEWKWFG